MRRVLALAAAVALLAGVSTLASVAAAAQAAPTWSTLNPAQVPPGDGVNSSMAYDAATGQVMMFGPSVDEGNCLPNVTWTWDGANWSGHQLPTAPAQRDLATMAYDGATKQLILFGGFGYDPGCHTIASELLRDTWAWNGSIWVAGASGDRACLRRVCRLRRRHEAVHHGQWRFCRSLASSPLPDLELDRHHVGPVGAGYDAPERRVFDDVRRGTQRHCDDPR